MHSVILQYILESVSMGGARDIREVKIKAQALMELATLTENQIKEEEMQRQMAAEEEAANTESESKSKKE